MTGRTKATSLMSTPSSVLPRRVEVLAIGDELLDGRVTDTNTIELARLLQEVGLSIAQRTTVTDDPDAIIREAQALIARGAELCVVSGGLGPTRDDLTSEAMAQLTGVGLVRDEAEAKRIAELLKRFGRDVTENQLKQADRPEGSTLVHNPMGTAPGFELVHQGCRFVAAPGVPREFRHVVESVVVGPLRPTSAPVERRVFLSFGLVEAEVDRRLAPLETRWPDVRVGFRARFPSIHVTIKAGRDRLPELEEAAAFAREQLGLHLYAEREISLAEVVVEQLRERGSTVAAAESCTGGKVSDFITEIPGASDVFGFGVVVYANEAKQALLGVSGETLAAHGAVSEACVREMAAGVRRVGGATYGIATSGIAGPTGGSPDKPVGTVWLALDGPEGQEARKLHVPFDRARNKVLFAHAALDLLRRDLAA